MKKKYRAAVIGLGMGRNHIFGFQSHPDVEVVALCDLDEGLLNEFAEKCKVPQTFTDYEEMLNTLELDFVSIATPNKFHKPMTMAALDKGAHVICEKPMALNTAEAIEMQTLADNVNRRIMIHFSYRFSDASWALKKFVDTGALGDIYFGRTIWHRRDDFPHFGGWFGIKALSGGGPLIDLGVHRMDLALWLMGYPKPVSVMGKTYDLLGQERAKKLNKTFDVEDLGAGMISFENGATLMVEASWGSHSKDGQHMFTRLLGTQGGIVQQNINGNYDGYEADFYTTTETGWKNEDIDLEGEKAPNPFYHFVDAVKNNTPHIATGEEGIKVMQILDALYQSAASGELVKIP